MRASRAVRLALGLTSARPRWKLTPVEREEAFVSIIRIGLAQTKNFSEGFDAIFAKKPAAPKKKAAAAKKQAPKKKGKKSKKSKKK